MTETNNNPQGFRSNQGGAPKSEIGSAFSSEDEVRKEWNNAKIGRSITQEEVDNWMKYGKQGQLYNELGRHSSDQSVREDSNKYHRDTNQWDKVVNEFTGQPISGWRDPNTGSISLSPLSSFGKGSIPLWGEDEAFRSKLERAINLYDEQVAGDSAFDPASSHFDIGLGVEGDWVAIPTGVGIKDTRLSAVYKDDKPIIFKDKNGVERTLYQKVSKKEKFGILGEKINNKFFDKLPGDIKSIGVMIEDTSSLGIGSQFYGGTEASSRGGKVFHGIFGGRAKDWDSATTEVVPQVAAAVAAVVSEGVLWWLPAAVRTAQGAGKAATAELQGRNVNWDKVAINTGTDWAVSYLGSVSTGYGIAADAAVTKSQGADWSEVATQVAFDTAGAYAGKTYGTEGRIAVKAGEAIVTNKDWAETAADLAFTYSVGELESSRMSKRAKSKGRSYNRTSFSNPNYPENVGDIPSDLTNTLLKRKNARPTVYRK